MAPECVKVYLRYHLEYEPDNLNPFFPRFVQPLGENWSSSAKLAIYFTDVLKYKDINLSKNIFT